MASTCQRCYSDGNDTWNMKQAELHIGRLDHWKVQLCTRCTNHVEQAVLSALKPDPAGLEAPPR